MLKHFQKHVYGCLSICLALSMSAHAQTDMDALMIPKNSFCTGVMYSYSVWKNYWEGDYKRDNKNMGNVSTQMLGIVGNYGITGNLNVLFNVPYVATKASGGTLKGLRGVQDLSLMLKWRAVKTTLGKGRLSIFGIGGVSTPLTNYVADFQPMSIGLHSTNLTVRGMADYQINKWFVTISGMYSRRSNIDIDRTAYYTTEMHYTNEVKMPDVAGFNIKTGYRSRKLIADIMFDKFNSLGGFDIRKNDMPFPSNKMNATRAGVSVKYSFDQPRGLELTAGGNYVLSGRNVGQASTVSAGVLYIMSFNKKNKISSKS